MAQPTTASQDPTSQHTPLAPEHALSKKQRRTSLVAVVSGNFLEWFDWTVYAIFTTYIAANFFHSGDGTSAVLMTLGVFAGGFFARPIGGLVFGRIGDRLGRKTALVLAMVMMGLGSAIIAVMPTYESIGVWASVGLFAARLIQGMAHGGESGNAYTYLAEIAPKDKRGLWGSSIMVTVTLGVMAATALGALLTSVLADDAMNSWGWRVAFGIGAVLAIFALFIRRQAEESQFFEEAKAEEDTSAARQISRKHLAIIALRIVLLTSLTMVLYYTWMSFFSAYAISSKGMAEQGAYLASLGAQVIAIIVLPLWGALSDRIGRKRQMQLWALAVMVIVFPVSWILTDEPWTLFLAQSIALVVWAMQASIHSTVMAEQAPTEARSTSVGVWSSVGAALTGGTAPYLNTWLTGMGLEWVFSAYIIVLAIVTLITLRFTPETAGLTMDEIPLPGEKTPPVTR